MTAKLSRAALAAADAVFGPRRDDLVKQAAPVLAGALGLEEHEQYLAFRVAQRARIVFDWQRGAFEGYLHFPRGREIPSLPGYVIPRGVEARRQRINAILAERCLRVVIRPNLPLVEEDGVIMTPGEVGEYRAIQSHLAGEPDN